MPDGVLEEVEILIVPPRRLAVKDTEEQGITGQGKEKENLTEKRFPGAAQKLDSASSEELESALDTRFLGQAHQPFPGDLGDEDIIRINDDDNDEKETITNIEVALSPAPLDRESPGLGGSQNAMRKTLDSLVDKNGLRDSDWGDCGEDRNRHSEEANVLLEACDRSIAKENQVSEFTERPFIKDWAKPSSTFGSNTPLRGHSSSTLLTKDLTLLTSPILTHRRTINIRNRDHIDMCRFLFNKMQHKRDWGISHLPDIRREFHRAGWADRGARLIRFPPSYDSLSSQAVLAATLEVERPAWMLRKEFKGDYLIILSKDASRQALDHEKFAPNEWNISPEGSAFGAVVITKVELVEKGAGFMKPLEFKYLPIPQGLEAQEKIIEHLGGRQARMSEMSLTEVPKSDGESCRSVNQGLL